MIPIRPSFRQPPRRPIRRLLIIIAAAVMGMMVYQARKAQLMESGGRLPAAAKKYESDFQGGIGKVGNPYESGKGF